MDINEHAVQQANADFYDAYESCDIDGMSAVWDTDDGDPVLCVHPGWAPVRGRSAVLRSWSLIMAHTESVQMFLSDVRVRVFDEVAVVTCQENVLTALSGEESGVTDGSRTATTNVFRRRHGGWRLWIHQASPVVSTGAEAPSLG